MDQDEIDRYGRAIALNADRVPQDGSVMQLETARAMIANPEGWNREDILKAARVLKINYDGVAANLRQRPTPTAREVIYDDQRQKCGRLLVAIAASNRMIGEMLVNVLGYNPTIYANIQKELHEAAIIFASTLDKP